MSVICFYLKSLFRLEKKIITTACIFFLNIYFCFGSVTTKQDTLAASNFYQRADSLLSKAQFDSSIFYFQKASRIFLQHKIYKRYLDCQIKLADNLNNKGEHDASLEVSQRVLERCLELFGPNSDQQARAYRLIGISYFSLGQNQKALDKYTASLEIYLSMYPKIHLEVAKTFSNMSVVYKEMKNYKAAKKHATMARDIYIELYGNNHALVATTSNNLGLVYLETGQYQKCITNFTRALDINKRVLGVEHINIPKFYHNLGTTYQDMGHYDLAAEHYNKALGLFLKILPKDHYFLAYGYQNLGIIYRFKGEFEKALQYQHRAQDILSASLGRRHPTTIRNRFNLGVSYHDKGNLEQAIFILESSLKTMSEELSPNSIEVAYSSKQLASALMKDKSFDNAHVKKLLMDALSIEEAIYGEEHPDIATTYVHLAEYYDKIELQDQALENLKKALSIRVSTLSKFHPWVSKIYLEIGKHHLENNKHELSLTYLEKSLRSNTDSTFKVPTSTLALHRHCLSQISLHETTLAQAKLYKSLFEKSHEVRHLEQSLYKYHQLDTMINLDRHSYLQYADKLAVSTNAYLAYQGAIQTTTLLGQLLNDESYKRQAFYFAEKSKSQLLVNAVHDISAKSFGLIPDSVLAFEKNLNIDLSFYESKIRETKSQKDEEDSLKLNNWKNKLLYLNRSRDSLTDKLESDYPRYHQLKYENNTISINEIQAGLDPNTALIEYFLGDSSLYTFTITNKNFEFSTTRTSSLAPNLIKDYREAMQRSILGEVEHRKDLIEKSHRIYQEYLAPNLGVLGSEINKLIIIPDGPLGYIPFDVLLTEKPAADTKNFQDLPYLLKKYQTQYGYSATLLFNDFERKELTNNKEFLAFAPSYEDMEIDSLRNLSVGRFRDQLTSLKWNQPEIEHISEYMDGTALSGSAAVEKAFKASAKDHSIIHLAMHALIDDKNPMNSKLVFSQEEDSLEDNYLHAYELYNMELPAQMAVLSACETGFGKLEKGEGIMSLARAFSYAGCPSVVMSHWSVNDAATSKLMAFFYKYLADGESKDRALQMAKLEFLEQADAAQANPFYWGSFVVMGDVSPVRMGVSSRYVWYGVVFLLIVMGLMFWMRKNASNS